ncbi:16S ribosomal RNA methyltransferase RsmE [Candidatus Omnitrophus magneticus]|uniref:Ribosomal RNA small subunit methyltransferase E n=1 Tax=Candidatus Omnitrophus magneticus TaxID=1609969 RepID=A0A0F0CVY0_9BACT|nr:16S ribosomal RNA methyltransferase RsmE [Candidatus Omnitrophus magneticus]
MSRFFAPKKNIDQEKSLIFIDGKEAHHIINVMRLGELDDVIIFDGEGNEYIGSIFSIDTKNHRVIVKILSSHKGPLETPNEIHLLQAIPKKDKMEYIIEKATELGVKKIIPVITDRTIVRPDKMSSLSKNTRWNLISETSAKQCGRADIPEIAPIQKYDDALKKWEEYSLILCASLTKKNVYIKDALKKNTGNIQKILLMIGPEGDFSPEEISQIEDHPNCVLISLGKLVLKSDTAGLFALSVISYELAMK